MALFGDEKREYQRKWLAKRRIEGIKYLGGFCSTCGSSEDLEIDHIDPKQKMSHRIWSWSWTRIIEELNKCQLLCVECHKIKTRRNGDVLNGLTDSVYIKVVSLLLEGTLSQRKIAAQLGISQPTVCRINTGIRQQ